MLCSVLECRNGFCDGYVNESMELLSYQSFMVRVTTKGSDIVPPKLEILLDFTAEI